MTDTERNFPVVTVSNQDNAKFLEQSKSGFKRTINCSKYLAKKSIERKYPYLDYLIYPSFQGVNRLFVLLFENENGRKVHTGYYIPKAEIKDYNVVIDGKNFLDEPVKNCLRTYGNIQKVSTVPGDNYIPGSIIDYEYSKDYFTMIAIDLGKQEVLDADRNAIQ